MNVDFDVYRIRTRITEQGATIAAGETGVYVDKRHKLTRAERLAFLNQDLTYTANQLDRDVVSESQIRTALQQFRDRVLPEAFPGRREVPKTLIFAKDDSHADDIVRVVREVFAEGNDFCQKITYRTGFTKTTRTVTNEDGTQSEVTEWVKTASLTLDEILANFRNSFYPRIAVTVDMISTGTDVKPIECVFFLRNVKSAGFFEQMKGRGVRVISPDNLRVVTASAKVKDRFIIVDAVGVCEQDQTDSHTLNRDPSATLEQLLNFVAQGGTDPEALTTLAGRLARMQREFSQEQLAELKDLAGGKSFPDLAHSNKQLNFVQHIYTLLTIDGRAAVVVPDNVLFEGGAGEKVRRNLLQKCRVHTLLRLPTGIWYSPGVKANVIFFDKKEGRAGPWSDKLWIYDLRTNLHFTLKQSPIQRKDFDEFVDCYKPGLTHERTPTWSEGNPEGRWRSYDYEELLKRDKLSLDLFWIKDKSLTDTDSLPAPDIIAAEIADDLEAALEQFTKIASRLSRNREPLGID